VDEPADFYIPMEANSVTPSVLNHSSLVSVANSQATAITNILDAAVGQEIRLKCGNSTFGVTIAASGNFSLLPSAWTPSVGDIIYLKKRSDGKFIELKRENVTSAAIALAANATAPDVSAGDKFITVANSGATALTTLTNAVTTRVYTLYGGSSTNATTIANGGNFSLTAAMTLNAGTWIQLQKAADGKFYEITRG
jgi:ABC-type proline/glycine betaine transport system substrate-binding protein